MVAALFLLRQLKRLLVVFKGMFSFDLFCAGGGLSVRILREYVSVIGEISALLLSVYLLVGGSASLGMIKSCT